MRQLVAGFLVVPLLLVIPSSQAHADSVVTITVSGAASGSRTFTSAMNVPINSGVFSIGAVSFANVSLTANQPGSATEAFATNTKTAVTNSSGGAVNVTVDFAANDFSLPLGPLAFNASQTINAVNFGMGNSISEQFTGYGDATNSLVAGTGIADVTGVCSVVAGNPTNACATSGPVESFAHQGNFALNGIETFALLPEQVADFSGSINAKASTVPEANSALLILIGAGLVIAGRRRFGAVL